MTVDEFTLKMQKGNEYTSVGWLWENKSLVALIYVYIMKTTNQMPNIHFIYPETGNELLFNIHHLSVWACVYSSIVFLFSNMIHMLKNEQI